MFDNNVFIENTCKNIVDSGHVIGFELKTNITYYRGIPLSMVNDIGVTVDGEKVAREHIVCSVDEVDWFTLDEMETITSYKWEYGEPLTVRVLNEGGLSKGNHEVALDVVVRTAYIPVPLAGSKVRTVEIA
ncbi:C-glycoside deglycosidase beta subunit domain-containing protein [Neobacillus drentensis]|uniref:C-glycoside deglycosidase beta subunit domain-containing protein n=1 Tax=Neobacillus drentensis TaxID=220684 RepID=UPI0030009A47